MRPKPSRQQVVTTSSVPAPIGGLNARDSIAAMPPTDAILVNNWFCKPTTLAVRGGSLDYATGITGVVETLMVYNGLSASKMFAAAGANIYDVTALGAVGAPVVTGKTSARWSYVNFGTVGAQALIAVNGVDTALYYNGTAWQPYSSGGIGAITSITAVGTLATVTMASPHGLQTGSTVTISGATPAAYNGTWSITVTGANTFTYVTLSAPGASASPVGTLVVSPNIQGVSSTLLIYAASFKGRLYFIEKNSLRVWYLPAAQLGGTAAVFDMSSVFKLGGHLVAMQSWNVDTVSGPNDYFAFFSNTGEVVVYTGYDPTQSSTWNLVGAFRIGRIAGPRAVTKVGSDLYVVTVDGVVPLSKAMLTDRSQTAYQVSDKIDNLINSDVQVYANNFGWQLILYPVGGKIIVNVPKVENVMQIQYVCNTITGAWSTFSGWNASCFELMNDNLFYGKLGKVVQADVGNTDNGTAIITDLKPAFSSFGLPAQNKQFTLVRPIFQLNGQMGITGTLNVDFRDNAPTSSLDLPPQANVSFWDVSPWDTSFWSVTGLVNINWQTVYGIGYQASYRMQTISSTDGQLLAIDYGYQPGGIY